MADDTELEIRKRLMGLGDKSVHKSYYPQLLKRLEELELFHSLLDHARDLIFLVDTNSGVVLDANQAACEFFGLPRVDLAWKSFLDLFELARNSPLHGGLDIGASGETHEVSHMDAQGKRVWFELTLSSILIAGHSYTVGVARDVSSRKHVEDALRESEKELRTLFEKAPVGIFRSTTEGAYLASNPANAAMLGYDSAEELLEEVQNIPDMVYRDPARRREFVRKLREQGEIKGFESHRSRKGGSDVWVSTSARLSVDPASGQEVIDGFSIDITERKLAEQEARDSREFLNKIINSIGDPIFVKDEQHRLVLVNDAQCELIGKPRNLILGRTDYDFFPRRQGDIFWEHDNHVLETGQEAVTEEDITDSTGRLRTIVTKKNRYVDAKGNRYVVGSIRDITERKLSERQLERSEEKFRSIVVSSPAAMFFFRLDPEGRFLLSGTNPAADRLLGGAGKAILGETIQRLLGHLMEGVDQEDLLEVARGEVGPRSFQVAHDQGRRTDFFDMHVFRTEDGAIAVDILDITDRVRMQEMMIQTEKMLSVGGLAAGMAHEINNPLGAIIGSAQNILRRLEPGRKANEEAAAECGVSLEGIRAYMEKRGLLEMVSTVKNSGQRAADIVRNMLEFSRKSEGQYVLTDVPALLDRAVELARQDYDLKKKYDFRQIEVIRQYCSDLPPVPCRPTEIEQVILNLLRNAAQAMYDQEDAGRKPAIHLRTLLDGNMARIEVSDNGPGLDETTRSRVFEPFFTTKPVGVGTGLGLSVSYFIVTNNHGGQFSVESRPGQGATFIIKLPLEAEAAVLP